MVYVPGEPYGQKFSIRPESGTMIIFPGFLYHFVHPYMGAGERSVRKYLKELETGGLLEIPQ